MEPVEQRQVPSWRSKHPPLKSASSSNIGEKTNVQTVKLLQQTVQTLIEKARGRRRKKREIKTVFESVPQPSKASISYSTRLEQRIEPIVYESIPRTQPTAEFKYDQPVSRENSRTLFESLPSSSTAEFKYDVQSSSSFDKIYFESNPKPSSTIYKSGHALDNITGKTLYENTASRSNADYKFDIDKQPVDSKIEFISEFKPSNAYANHKTEARVSAGQFENNPRLRSSATYNALCQPAQDIKSVFENIPEPHKSNVVSMSTPAFSDKPIESIAVNLTTNKKGPRLVVHRFDDNAKLPPWLRVKIVEPQKDTQTETKQ